MSKYIIKNCPAIYSDEYCKENTYEDGSIHCQDCTDCILKQIVEKCKNTQFLPTKNRFVLYAVKVFANDLLQPLDIQEVE